MKVPAADYQKALKAYEADLKAFDAAFKRQSRKGKAKAKDGESFLSESDHPQPPPPPTPPLPSELDLPLPRLKPGEMENFVKLSAALTLLLGRTITKPNIARGCQLLKEYLLGFREVRLRSRMASKNGC